MMHWTGIAALISAKLPGVVGASCQRRRLRKSSPLTSNVMAQSSDNRGQRNGALVSRVPFVLVVNPALPIQSVADLISYAKAHPGELTYGSGGAGSPHQLYAEMFKTATGIEMTHVPYKGTAPALADVIG